MSRTATCSALAFAAALLGTDAARAADHFPAYFGRWTIAEAHPAPWVDSANPSPSPSDDGLIGKTVTYSPDRISGPRPLRCGKPDYRFVDAPPEGLFQGNLTRPAEQARTLGFPAGAVRTLQTGCEGFIDFHFTESGAMLFALNNLIYTLRKR